MFQGRHIFVTSLVSYLEVFLPLVDLILEAFFDEREVQPQHE